VADVDGLAISEGLVMVEGLGVEGLVVVEAPVVGLVVAEGLTEGGGFWGAIGAINDNFGILGYIIVGIFILSWLISFIIYRAKRYDEIEIATPEVS